MENPDILFDIPCYWNVQLYEWSVVDLCPTTWSSRDKADASPPHLLHVDRFDKNEASLEMSPLPEPLRSGKLNLYEFASLYLIEILTIGMHNTCLNQLMCYQNVPCPPLISCSCLLEIKALLSISYVSLVGIERSKHPNRPGQPLWLLVSAFYRLSRSIGYDNYVIMDELGEFLLTVIYTTRLSLQDSVQFIH